MNDERILLCLCLTTSGVNINIQSGAAKLSLPLEVDETVGGVGREHFSSGSRNGARKFQQRLINIRFQLFLMILPTAVVINAHLQESRL